MQFQHGCLSKNTFEFFWCVFARKREGHEPMSKNYRGGGLYRCCIQTLMDTIFENDPKEEDKLPCDYCDSSLIYKNDAWEWNKDG